MKSGKATQFNKFSDRHNFKSELINGAQLVGTFDFPKLKQTDYVPKKLIPFNMAKTEKTPKSKCLHFFIDDYQFERLWNYPKRYPELLKRFDGVIAPDFSMYSSMPFAQQIWNCYRSRAMAFWMQSMGINTIPVVEWADYSNLEWCLDGLPLNSTLATGTYGCNKSQLGQYGLVKGVEKICNSLLPKSLVVYGREIKSINSLCENVIWFDNYCKELKKRI